MSTAGEGLRTRLTSKLNKWKWGWSTGSGREEDGGEGEGAGEGRNGEVSGEEGKYRVLKGEAIWDGPDGPDLETRLGVAASDLSEEGEGDDEEDLYAEDNELILEERRAAQLSLERAHAPPAAPNDFPERNGFVRVWLRDDELGWWKGYLDAEQNVVDLRGGVRSSADADFCRVNPDDFHDHVDTVELQNLHEAPVLDLIRRRFEASNIYTCVGKDVLLISVNPCAPIPGLYSRRSLRRAQVAGGAVASSVPHVFNTANATYRGMMQERRPQSVIVSGDSGAGKTEAAKLVLRYLAFQNEQARRSAAATAGGRPGAAQPTLDLEAAILETNPILEAFGNAKTHLNHNSSRFGKLLQVLYNDRGVIIGARIREFLLEKSRVVGELRGQRNFHIFYQLLSGCTEQERAKYHLLTPQEYRYLNRTGCYVAEGIDDAASFQETCEAFRRVGFTEEEVDALFRLLSGILRIGNLQYVEGHDGDDTVDFADRAQVQAVAELLRMDSGDLETAMTRRKINAGGEEILKSYKLHEAEGMRDGLAKAIYKQLFSFVVMRLNELLIDDNPRHRAECRLGLHICLLDQAGFEIFQENSLEQLLINFSNEKMQEQFHERISFVEKQAYLDEGIDWKKGFNYNPRDNLLRVQALESHPHGVLEVLNEEGRVPNGSDDGFLERLSHSAFVGKDAELKTVEIPRIRSHAFTFHHFAGQVSYSVAGMLEKNRDFLHRDLEDALADSLCPILSAAFLPQDLESVGGGGGGAVSSSPSPGRRSSRGGQFLTSRTVWIEFRPQINDLVQTLKQTTPRYIRCIKPNDALTPGVFNAAKVLRQLHYSGVLEFISVRRNGLPVRLQYEYFANHFRIIIDPARRELAARDIVGAVLEEEEPVARASLAREGSFAGGRREVSLSWALGSRRVFISDALHKWLEDRRLRAITGAMVFCMTKLRVKRAREWRHDCRRKAASAAMMIRALLARRRIQRVRAAANLIRQRVRENWYSRKYSNLLVAQETIATAWYHARVRRDTRRTMTACAVLSRGMRASTAKKGLACTRASMLLQRVHRRRVLRRRMMFFHKMKATLIYGSIVRKMTAAMVAWKERYIAKQEAGAIVQQQAYRATSARRRLRTVRTIVPAQSAAKAHLAAHSWRRTRELQVATARLHRGAAARRQVQASRAALNTLRTSWRHAAAVRLARSQFGAAQLLQRGSRGFQVRKQNKMMMYERLQSGFRGFQVANEYRWLRATVSTVCAGLRRARAARYRAALRVASPRRFSPESGYAGPPIHALVLGPAGTGKSSLTNTLLAKNVRVVESLFDDLHDAGTPGGVPATPPPDAAVELGDCATARVALDRTALCIYDSEAISDFTSAELVRAETADEALEMVYIFVDRIDSPRTPRESLRAIAAVFGRRVWERTIFVFTDCDVTVQGLSFERLLQRKKALVMQALKQLGATVKAPNVFAIDNLTARHDPRWLSSLDSIYRCLESSAAARSAEVLSGVGILQRVSRRQGGRVVRDGHTAGAIASAWRKLECRANWAAARWAANVLETGIRRGLARRRARRALAAAASLQGCQRARRARRAASGWRGRVVAIQRQLRAYHAATLFHRLRRAAPDRFDLGPERVLIVCGADGVGKSSLTQTVLMQKEHDGEADEFSEEHGEIGMDVSKYSRGRLTVYDVESIGDVASTESVRRALGFPEAHSQSIFLFVDRFDSARLPRASLRSLSQTFGPRMWKRAVIVLTHADGKVRAAGAADLDAVMKRKVRAFNAAITSILAELADGDPLSNVPVVCIDTKRDPRSGQAIEATTELMDVLESRSDERIAATRGTTLALGRLWRARKDHQELSRVVGAQCALAGAGRLVSTRLRHRALVSASLEVSRAARRLGWRHDWVAARRAQVAISTAHRKLSALCAAKDLHSAAAVLRDALRGYVARSKRATLLRASPARFKANLRSRQIGAVVIGADGVGKSAFINALFKEQRMKVKDAVMASLQMESGIEAPPVTAVDYPEADFRMYETFSISDIIGAQAVANELRDPLEHPLTSFVFVDKFDNRRVPKDVLAACTTAFGPSVWNRSVIVLTHADVLETYQSQVSGDVDILGVKAKAYNSAINDIVAEQSTAQRSSEARAVNVPVFLMDNNATREDARVLESLANLLDVLKEHASSSSYLFSFQGINPQSYGAGAPREAGPKIAGARADPEAGEGPRAATGGVHRDRTRTRTTRSRRRRSHYEILGVAETATASDIRRAYKDLARKFHPDRNPEDADAAMTMFREISEAYDKLLGMKADGLSSADAASMHDNDEGVAHYTTGFPVYIRTHHKRYWTTREGEELRCNCKERELSPLERLEIRWVQQGGFIIRGHNEKILVLADEGDRVLMLNKDDAFSVRPTDKIPRYMFKIMFLDEGRMIISAANHKFIVAERNGTLRANRESASGWETFSWQLAPSDSGEELKQNPLVVNLCSFERKFVDVNPHEIAVSCRSSHPATAERFSLEPVHGQLFKLRGSDGRLLCVAHDGSLIMGDEEDDDFFRIVRLAEFLAEFSDCGRVVLSVVDINERLFVSVEIDELELRNRKRKNADLSMRICFEDSQMMRQLEFFSDEHLPWMKTEQETTPKKPKVPIIPNAAEVMPTRFSMYRHF